MTEMEFLNFEVRGKKIIDMTRREFYEWLLRRINGMSSMTADAAALRLRASSLPLGNLMMEHEKIDVCRQMEREGIFGE